MLQACAGFNEQYVSDRTAQWEKMSAELVGSLEAKQSLLFGTSEAAALVRRAAQLFVPHPPGGLYGLQTKHGYSLVYVPGELLLPFPLRRQEGCAVFIPFRWF